MLFYKEKRLSKTLKMLMEKYKVFTYAGLPGGMPKKTGPTNSSLIILSWRYRSLLIFIGTDGGLNCFLKN